MILTGKEIIRAVVQKNLVIIPFSSDCVNPNSYDISIGNSVFSYPDGVVLDGNIESMAEEFIIPPNGLLLRRNKFYYAMSTETVVSKKYVPMLHNRSGVARKGMFTHITADLQQKGHHGRVILQLLPFADTLIFPGQQIAQLSFWRVF